MRRLAIICAVFGLSVPLGSCESTSGPDDNFVTVHVQARAVVYVRSREEDPFVSRAPFSEGQLVLTVTKAGGEFESLAGSPDAGGHLGPLTATFKVYREQRVELSLRVLGGFLPPAFGGDVCDPAEWLLVLEGGSDLPRLEWFRIEDKMGEEFYWSPEVEWSLLRVP